MASKVKYPKALGACVDLLYTKREERLAAQRAADAMKEEEQALEDHILATFSKQELGGSKGKVASAGIKTVTTVNVTDWDKFLAYTVKNKAWDLLRKQPASRAVQERWEHGVEVPGTEPFHKISLSLTKIGGKV